MKLSGFWSGLDWDNWSYNLVKGIVSGGASSAQSALTMSIVDATHFSLGSKNSFEVIGVAWLIGAAGFTFAFMSKTGLPDKKQREETFEVKQEGNKPATVTMTTKDTSIVAIETPPVEPAKPPKA